MKKEKFNELIRAVQNASTGKLGKISPDIRDQMHQLYESFKKEVDENINETGYDGRSYVYLKGLFFELSEHKRKTPGFMSLLAINNDNPPLHPGNVPRLKKNIYVATYVQSCYCSDRTSYKSLHRYMRGCSTFPIAQANTRRPS